MSAEFGDNPGGFFHEKIRYAADDCLGVEEHEPITHATGEFLDAFYQFARDISLYQAGDISELALNARMEWSRIRQKFALLQLAIYAERLEPNGQP